MCDGFGIKHYDFSSNKLNTISLPVRTKVTSVVFDKKNNLWIGANEYVLSYSIKDSITTVFNDIDGVNLNDYWERPSIRSSKGDILMGGTNGLLLINSDITIATPDNVKGIAFNNAILNGNPIEAKNNMGIKTIVLPHNFGLLSLSFHVNKRLIFGKEKIKYRITGKAQNTIEFETINPTLTINSLLPGKYQITASYLSRTGNYVPIEGPIMEIIVNKPLMQTWPMQIMKLATIGLILLIITYYFRQKRRRKEAILVNQNKQTMAEYKINLLINISHELRTPLTLIYAPLKRMLKQNGIDSSMLKDQLSRILGQATKMQTLIDMVLGVRSLEIDRENLNIRSLLINEWIKELINEFILEFAAKEVSLSSIVDDRINYVNFDESKCRIVLSNFLMNALKYSKPNTDVIVKSELQETNSIRISVIDQGIGLGNVDVNNLFNQFYQANKKSDGYGLGLAYCKTLIDALKGRIGAHENPQGGAIFFIELPLTFETSELISNKSIVINTPDELEQIYDDFKVSDKSILVVDDEVNIVNMLYDAYFPLFENVYKAFSGEEALEIIYNKKPDIVVSDVMMPKVNGFELCKIIKTDINISHTPIILLTARVDEHSKLQGYKVGADSYIAKPFDLDLLLTVIKNTLRTRVDLLKKISSNSPLINPHNETFSAADELFVIKFNDFIEEHISDITLNIDSIASHMDGTRTRDPLRDRQ